MIKNLKNLVIFLGIIVLLLFSITIVSLIYKLKNRDETRDVGTFVSLLDTKAFDSTVLIILLSIMTVGLL